MISCWGVSIIIPFIASSANKTRRSFFMQAYQTKLHPGCYPLPKFNIRVTKPKKIICVESHVFFAVSHGGFPQTKTITLKFKEWPPNFDWQPSFFTALPSLKLTANIAPENGGVWGARKRRFGHWKPSFLGAMLVLASVKVVIVFFSQAVVLTSLTRTFDQFLVFQGLIILLPVYMRDHFQGTHVI